MNEIAASIRLSAGLLDLHYTPLLIPPQSFHEVLKVGLSEPEVFPHLHVRYAFRGFQTDPSIHPFPNGCASVPRLDFAVLPRAQSSGDGYSWWHRGRD